MSPFNEDAREAYYQNKWGDRQELLKKAKEAESAEWWARYNAYLNSPEWNAKRKMVLQRDNNICQACLVRAARHVHHKTYEHLFDEPAFDLESVCVPCHERIHKKPL